MAEMRTEPDPELDLESKIWKLNGSEILVFKAVVCRSGVPAGF